MKLATDAVRKIDANHLILGVRIAEWAPEPVIRAVGEYSDVFSVNWYVKNGRPDPAHLDNVYLAARKPVMITEFSYRAMENRSGLRNSRGADVTVPAQGDRALRYTRYVELLAALPEVVGFHWFEYFDQPTLGRFDGEDSNYGLVDQRDEPYAELLASMKEMNRRAAEIHAGSALKLPAKRGEPRPRPRIPVVGVDVKKDLGARPFPGFSYAEYPGTAVRGGTWGDESSGSGGTFTGRGGRAVFAFVSGPGWGCGVSPERERRETFDVAGAARVRIRFSASKGARFRVIVNESGVRPLSASSFNGERGADGEQYSSEDITGTGGMQDVGIELAGLGLSSGYGNPSGNCRLDAQALSRVELFLPPGQGKGEIEIASIRFE
jgi:hypothetical protein